MLVSLTSLRYKSLFLLVHIREVSILVCVSACVCVWCVCVCGVCVCMYVCVLRTVSLDKVLHFMNTYYYYS